MHLFFQHKGTAALFVEQTEQMLLDAEAMSLYLFKEGWWFLPVKGSEAGAVGFKAR